MNITKDYVIISVPWFVEFAEQHRRVQGSAQSNELILSKFRNLADFFSREGLFSEGFTPREVDLSFELRRSHLNDRGFAFLKTFLKRFSNSRKELGAAFFESAYKNFFPHQIDDID